MVAKTEKSQTIDNEKIPYSESREKDLALKLKLKNLLKEWILSSTSHGLPNIFRTDQIYLKLIWLIFFLASTGFCLLLITNYVITFFSYGVSVSTTIENETPIKFPAVTICNLNPFYYKRSTDFTREVLINNNLTYMTNLTSINQTALSLLKEAVRVLKSEAATNPRYNSTYRQNLGFYIDELLISCYYSNTQCSSPDFRFLQTYDYGNCYTFNSGINSTIKTISNAGPGHGLEIELFSGDPDVEFYSYKRGFYVVVHNQSTTPIMDNEGVYVSIGTETNIGVDRTLYYKLDSPYSNCIKDPTSLSSSNSILYKAILTTLGESMYRQKYCYKLCYQLSVIQKCSCNDAQYANPFPNYDDKINKACRSVSELECKMGIYNKFEQEGVDQSCEELCPEECLTIKYATSVHAASYPNDFYLNILKLQRTFTDRFKNQIQATLMNNIKNTIVKINVFYNDISYTKLEESATITSSDLLGNIGGQLGLFIGISLLSFIEVIEILFEIIRTIFIHFKMKTKVKKINVF